MEFSSSSSDDEALARELRRHRRQQEREEAAITQQSPSSRTSSGSRSGAHAPRGVPSRVALPTGYGRALIEVRRGTVYIPVRDRYVHIHEAQAHPHVFFGDPSIRITRRPPLPAARILLQSLTPDGHWVCQRLSDASVTGVFVFDRVEPPNESTPHHPTQRNEASNTTTTGATSWRDVLGDRGLADSFQRFHLASPYLHRRRTKDAQLQRTLSPASWLRDVDRPGRFLCIEDVSWPTPEGRRLCHAATVDAQGVIWALDDHTHTLYTLHCPGPARIGGDARSSTAPPPITRTPVALLPPIAGTPPASRPTMGVVRLSGFAPGGGHADMAGDEGAGGAVVVVTPSTVLLAMVPDAWAESADTGAAPQTAPVLALPMEEEPYDAWCVTHRTYGPPRMAGWRPSSSITTPLATTSAGTVAVGEREAPLFVSSLGLTLCSERHMDAVWFESDAATGSRWRLRQRRPFPKASRVTSLGTAGDRDPVTGQPAVLLAGMRNGTIQLRPSDFRFHTRGAKVDPTPRHDGASVVSLHPLTSHTCQFASVSTHGEVRVWDLRYFVGARDPVSTARLPTRMNYDGNVKVSWSGDWLAVVSEPGGFLWCGCATRPSGQGAFESTGDTVPPLRGDPTVLLTRTGADGQLLVFGDDYTRCISLECL